MVGGGRYDPEHKPSFMKGAQPRNFVSMYPFVKTPDWYLLPYEQRRAMMAEHGQLGRRYTEPRPTSHAAVPGSALPIASGSVATATALPEASPYAGAVLSNTVDAYGLGDYEFVVAFESDDPAALCRMVEELRTVDVRRYTKVDTPIFLGRRREPADVLADL
jgi:chlorite dismutase